ncbi:hypothetical protein BGZ67_004445 [Mortierella alpina]|nr:hypothetical protein BGZ67_004445 [Mortierella alpina]
MAQQPSYGGAQPRIPPTYREERDRDRERDRMASRGRRDLPPGTELLFPASRYAAPFLRDYEIQQREGRRRMTQSPPPPPSSSSVQPTPPHESVKHGQTHHCPVPAAPSMPAYADDDGPYEEAIVWARASMPAAAPTSSTGATDGS